jgi:hypothetical protein
MPISEEFSFSVSFDSAWVQTQENAFFFSIFVFFSTFCFTAYDFLFN